MHQAVQRWVPHLSQPAPELWRGAQNVPDEDASHLFAGRQRYVIWLTISPTWSCAWLTWSAHLSGWKLVIFWEIWRWSIFKSCRSEERFTFKRCSVLKVENIFYVGVWCSTCYYYLSIGTIGDAKKYVATRQNTLFQEKYMCDLFWFTFSHCILIVCRIYQLYCDKTRI